MTSAGGRAARAALAASILFLALWGATAAGALDRADLEVSAFVSSVRTPVVTEVLRVLTWLGSSAVLAPVVAVAGAAAWLRTRDVRPALFMLAALVGAVVLYQAFKVLQGRPRPDAAFALGRAFAGSAFPSGHAAGAAATWGAVAVVLVRLGRRWAAAAAVTLVLVVGFSRVWLGAHWASDVVGGWLLGGAWLAVLVASGLAGRIGSNQSDLSRGSNSMALGYDTPLYILAFDHRGSFKKVFGFSGELSPEERERMSDGKMLIFEGVQRALADGAQKDRTGILVDEEFGADILRQAKKDDVIFAMPAEKSGQDEFDFEYGEDFTAHIEEFDPSFLKVLVRYNPESDEEMNARQTERLKRLSDWLHANGRKFLFELLVPAEPHQLEKAGGDEDRYDTEIRPALMLTAIMQLQHAGVEPDVWKIEGIDTREDCQRLAVQARSHGRDQVACVVLGRGADDEKVAHWLRQGAGLPGYVGFAIGRTIWNGPLKAYLAGEVDREAAAKRIGDNYRKFIEVWETASEQQRHETPEPSVPERPNPPGSA